MKKFWEWMVKKGYGGFNKYTEVHYLYTGSGTCVPKKQMLIGYMTEYLIDKDKSWSLFDSFDEIYNETVSQICDL